MRTKDDPSTAKPRPPAFRGFGLGRRWLAAVRCVESVSDVLRLPFLRPRHSCRGVGLACFSVTK
ncbi:unnamed protein product, partial [Musa hybrid cultivar]